MADLPSDDREQPKQRRSKRTPEPIAVATLYLVSPLPVPGAGMRPTLNAAKHHVDIGYLEARGVVVVSGVTLKAPLLVPISNVAGMVPVD